MALGQGLRNLAFEKSVQRQSHTGLEKSAKKRETFPVLNHSQ